MEFGYCFWLSNSNISLFLANSSCLVLQGFTANSFVGQNKHDSFVFHSTCSSLKCSQESLRVLNDYHHSFSYNQAESWKSMTRYSLVSVTFLLIVQVLLEQTLRKYQNVELLGQKSGDQKSSVTSLSFIADRTILFIISGIQVYHAVFQQDSTPIMLESALLGLKRWTHQLHLNDHACA